jgi:hypothetical protein
MAERSALGVLRLDGLRQTCGAGGEHCGCTQACARKGGVHEVLAAVPVPTGRAEVGRGVPTVRLVTERFRLHTATPRVLEDAPVTNRVQALKPVYTL